MRVLIVACFVCAGVTLAGGCSSAASGSRSAASAPVDPFPEDRLWRDVTNDEVVVVAEYFRAVGDGDADLLGRVLCDSTRAREHASMARDAGSEGLFAGFNINTLVRDDAGVTFTFSDGTSEHRADVVIGESPRGPRGRCIESVDVERPLELDPVLRDAVDA